LRKNGAVVPHATCGRLVTNGSKHGQAGRTDCKWLRQLSTGAAGAGRIAGLALLSIAAPIVILPLLATKATALGNTPAYTLLHLFNNADGADGAGLQGGLIRDELGNLYGATVAGGNGDECVGPGCGVVFKLDPSGNETVLCNFQGGADGAYPYAGLVPWPRSSLPACR
jgi:uncharacterized repeat protein (TIGR03803 family)